MRDEEGFAEDEGGEYSGHEEGDRQDGGPAGEVFHRGKGEEKVSEEGRGEIAQGEDVADGVGFFVGS